MLPFVSCGTQNQKALTCAGFARQAYREPCSDSNTWLPCHAETPSYDHPLLRLPPPTPTHTQLAPLFPHLINLSAKPFDTQHNTVPVFHQFTLSLSIWFQHFKISQLTHKVCSPGASGPKLGGVSSKYSCYQQWGHMYFKSLQWDIYVETRVGI